MSYKSKVLLAVLFLTLAVLMLLAYNNSLPLREQVSHVQESSQISTTSRHDDVQSSNRSTMGGNIDVQSSNRYTTSRHNDVQSSNTSTTFTSRHYDTQSSTTSRPDYNFTDNSVETLEKKLKECSLAMGFRQDSLSSKELVIHSVATKLSDYLNALRSIIPQQFLSSYHSPCWRSPIILSTKQRKGLKSIKEKNQKELDSLYKSISAPSLNPSKKSLMCLPAFFVAGFPKSGTTTLHTVLHGHKEIAVAKKEPHWWTRAPLVKGTNPNYLRLTTLYYIQRYYNLANSEVQEDHQLLIYDASQSTLWDSIFHVDNQDYCAMPIAVSHILPSAKFVVVMRNPVERIFSHYVSFCTGKNSQPPPSNVFHESVVANVNFFRKCVSKNHSVYECANDKQFTKPPITVGCGAVGYHLIIGMYYLHLKKWMQFYPRESFLFLRTDDMSSQPAIFMNNITDFLNINQFPENTSNMLTHRKNVQKLHMEMLPETRAILSEFYRPFNEMLVELTGDRRFHW